MKTLLLLLVLSFTVVHLNSKQPPCTKTKLALSYKKNPNATVFKLDSNVVGFVSEMTIDIDGSPRAYNPQDTGIDALASAGGAGHLSKAVIVFKGNNPYIQKSTDPFPGYFLSQTALTDKRFADTNYRRYVNSDSIPYISLPFNMFTNAKLGDIVFVFNKKTNKSAFAIVADKGDNTHIGEGSMALAAALGIKLAFSKKKHQVIGCDAVDGNIAYVVFKNTGTGKPLTVQEIKHKAEGITEAKAKEYVDCLMN